MNWLMYIIFMIENIRPGVAIVKFTPDIRNYIDSKEIFLKKTGINEIDEIFSEIGIYEIEKLFRGARPDRRVDKELGMDLFYILKFDEREDVISVIEKLKKSKYIEVAEPDYPVNFFYIPNDPQINAQWHFNNIFAFKAWDLHQGSEDIVIGINDTGTDWDHEDLWQNMWQNLGEDADGDGKVIEIINGVPVFDPGDINGIDNDGNGYIDDFVGWDFYENNNDPSPAYNGPDYEHGTHVSGIASAATDNGIGVAGTGFKCKIMGLRTYWLSNCASANYYATNKGADVINMSWGGWSSSIQQSIDYAYANGVLCVAAAGNDNSQNPSYPAYYYKCMAVASSNINNRKAYYSNYGTWIDITAPGGDGTVDPMIRSTLPDNQYGNFQGTSMASPVVAGGAALIKSLNPLMSLNDLWYVIQTTASPMPNETLWQQGLMGAGLLNLHKAVIYVGRQLYSYLEITQYNFIDDGDNDGRPDPSENVTVYLTVYDSAGWQNANNVTLKLRTNDPDIILIDSVSFLGNIPAGSYANNNSDPLIFSVIPNAIPHLTSIRIAFYSTPTSLNKEDTITFILAQPYILIVDDDGGSNYEKYYFWACDSLNLVYDYWDISTQGIPKLHHPTHGILNHKLTIWFTGSQTSTLSQEEQDTLIQALNNGAYLFISSQNLGEDIGSSNFYQNYLKAHFVSSPANNYFVYGIPGDEIGNGLKVVTTGAGGANNANSQDKIEPLSGADSVFYYSNTNGSANYGCAAIKYDAGTYKIVYFAFPFEAINNDPIGFTDREEVLERILNWMNISVKERKKNFYFNEKINITFFGNTLLIQFNSTGLPLEISLIDVTGRNIKTLFKGSLLKENTKKFELKEIKKGIYFINVKTLYSNIFKKIILLK